MRAQLRQVNDHGVTYEALVFWCPGCENERGGGGLHMLPVNTTAKSPSWTFDGNLDAPTLEPSILSRRGPGADDLPPAFVCHSYLRAGVFEFLSDCTHALAGTSVELPDLPEWATRIG